MMIADQQQQARGTRASGTSKTLKTISWNELEQHNVKNDCWLSVRGKVYDVTTWIDRHPGGTDTIVLNGGKDATQLFEAYHPMKVNQVLEKYLIGQMEGPSVEHPAFPPMSEFYITLKQKIEDHFSQKKMSPRYAPEMLLRTVFLISSAFFFHYLSVVSQSFSTAVLCAAIAGVHYALISFMPVHEGSHASTTESPLAWRLLGAVHDFVNGASFYTWCHQHFLGHHPFTNLTNGDPIADSLDPDVCTNDPDIRRIKPSQRWYNHYQFQQIYVPVLYGLLGIKYRINDLTIMFVSRMNGKIKVNPPDTWHLTMFIAGKLFFLTYRIIVPAITMGSLSQALLLFALSDAVTSYILAFVFQVNHVVPQAKWPTVNKETGIANMDWAEMQLRTTLDYGHGSWWTTFLTGALNYQVTHHLFPYICQLHYPDIAPIIQQHCKKYDLPYHCLPNFWQALKCHFKYLAIMGHEHSDY